MQYKCRRYLTVSIEIAAIKKVSVDSKYTTKYKSSKTLLELPWKAEITAITAIYKQGTSYLNSH